MNETSIVMILVGALIILWLKQIDAKLSPVTTGSTIQPEDYLGA
jgi:hypothetical protein